MSFNWESFLTEWIELERLHRCPEDVIHEENNPYLGFPGASEVQIIETERRLGVALPPSYKRFISFTNGWYKNSIGYAYQQLLPIEEVDWFRVKNRGWIEIYAETMGYNYDDIPILTEKSPSNIDFRDAQIFLQCLKSALQISEIGDCDVVLLIPDIVNNNKESESWYFADWLADANQYISFEELMIRSFVIQKYYKDNNLAN